jgi:lipopolysaccharide heptosyltransferase I
LIQPALFSRLNENVEPRILVIKPSALGDICHALPVLEFLASRFPRGKIDWVVNRSFAPLLVPHPAINSVIPFDRKAISPWKFVQAWSALINRLRQGRYDLVIDLQGLLRSAVMASATGCSLRLGPGDAREGARFLYSHQSNPGPVGTHAIMRNWAFAKMLGAGPNPSAGRMFVAPESLSAARQLLASRPSPYWMLAPGARWITKRWPVDHFATIGKRLIEAHGGTAVVVGAPDEKDITTELAHKLGTGALALGGETTVSVLSGLLAHADLVIANDSGPLHLACSLGRPVASPFLCTRIDLTGPYGQISRAIAAPVGCQGSMHRICPTRQECMAALNPDLVWNAITSSLSGPPPWSLRIN